MSQVIACPNCDKKLAVKDELKGRALICPQCKGRFTVPADEPQSAAEVFDLVSDKAPPSGGSDMDFFESLVPSPVPAAAKTATKTASASRPAATARPTAAQSPASPIDLGATRASASRAKKKDEQMMIYIGGGIAAAVVVIVLVVLIVKGMSSSNRSVKKQKNENIRFGMTETQRKKLFQDMLHAVDENGVCKECRDEWRRLGSESKLTDQQISDVLKEGMDQGWEQPALPATTVQKQKTNRREWIRNMTETHREPIMSQ